MISFSENNDKIVSLKMIIINHSFKNNNGESFSLE